VDVFFGIDEPEVFQDFIPDQAHLVHFLPVFRICHFKGVDRKTAYCLQEEFAALCAYFHDFSDLPVVLKKEEKVSERKNLR